MSVVPSLNRYILEKEKAVSTQRRKVNLLRYTGPQLARRDMRKFIQVVYQNFIDLAEDPQLGHTKEELKDLVTSPQSIIIIGTIDGVIVCYLIAKITVVENLKQLMHIYYIFTAPAYRGRGLATVMLILIQKYSKEMNINTLSLTFDTYNKTLERFYMNNHFVYDSNLRSYKRHDMLVKYI